MPAKLIDGKELRRWTEVDSHYNLRCIIQDLATGALIFGVAAALLHKVQGAGGWNLLWCLPIVVVTKFLIGAVQHRLACMMHEASHYTLVKNRFWNDLLGDVLLAFPIFATLSAYRNHHLGHHLYPNDWEKDPNLLNGGRHKLMDQFPMEKKSFIYKYYIRFFWPPFMLRHMWDIIYVSSLGSGIAPVPVEHRPEQPDKVFFQFRLPSILGIVWILSLALTMMIGNSMGSAALVFGGPVVITALAYFVWWKMDDHLFFRPKNSSGYTFRHSSAVRMAFYTVLLCSIAWTRYFTGFNLGFYFALLWLLPLVTTFPYFMLLREVYQHANADTGELTNSRVVYPDPFTGWAVLMYGQDVHLVHHLYPNVPNDKLLGLHKQLQSNEEYAQKVVEVEGTFHSRNGKPAMLDLMTEKIA